MSHTWTQPKTNWSRGSGASTYDGDRFTYEDFNRIMNNILYLYELATAVYPINAEIERRESIPSYYFDLQDGYDNRTLEDYVYADEVNYFENRLDYLKEVTGATTPGSKETHVDNGVFIDAEQLNYLETLSLELYNIIHPIFIGRRRLSTSLSQYNYPMDL